MSGRFTALPHLRGNPLIVNYDVQELFKGVIRDTERINQKLAERRAA